MQEVGFEIPLSTESAQDAKDYAEDIAGAKAWHHREVYSEDGRRRDVCAADQELQPAVPHSRAPSSRTRDVSERRFQIPS